MNNSRAYVAQKPDWHGMGLLLKGFSSHLMQQRIVEYKCWATEA